MMLAVTDLTVIEGGARISDRQLSETLGFTRIDSFHKLINAHIEELRDFGEVFRFEAKNLSPNGGRPTIGYLLNEHQAVALCMWAETPKARVGRKLIIEVFVAWHRGDLVARASGADGITIPKDEYIALLRSENAALRAPEKKPRAVSRPLTDEDRAEILRLLGEGFGVCEVSRQVGRSTATISLLRAGFRMIDGGVA